MANSNAVYVVHATDAEQHLGYLTQILKALKSENRIDNYSTVEHDSVTEETFKSLGEGDMVITMLTKGLIGLQARIEETLIGLTHEQPKYKKVEIIVDNIPYHDDFIALPMSLEPIRDSEDMDGVWKQIGMELMEMLPLRKKKGFNLKPFIPYAIGIAVIALGFWVWKSGLFTKVPTAAFSYNVLDPVKGDVIAEAEECYLPCKVLLNNKSKDAEKIIWELKDTIIEDVDEPVHVYLKPDMYNMTLTASAGKKRSIYSRQLKVKAPPFASFEITNNGCTAPCSIEFKNTSVAVSKYSWSFDGVAANSDIKETPAPRLYNTDGIFNVILVAENEEGIKTDTIRQVEILKDNTPFPEFKTVKIAGGTNPQQKFRFTNLSKNGNTYVWNFGDGTLPKTVFNKQPIDHTFKGYNTYAVSLKVIGTGGDSREFVQPVRVRNKFTIPGYQIYDAKVLKDVMKVSKKSVIPGINQ